MKAMILNSICDLANTDTPLQQADIPVPEPGNDEILIRVSRCGVCHTELDEIEGRARPAFFPVILGHQAVGIVVKKGKNVTRHNTGDRVGVAWIFSSCGKCEYCKSGNENLCPEFKATGKDSNGGYAEFMVIGENYAYRIPEEFTDSEAAPLLCAGAIGYRSLRLCNLKNGQNLGLTGFGASAHLVMKLAGNQYPDSGIFVFARSSREREFAKELGARWAGDTNEKSPEQLHAIIDTTPVWNAIVYALKNLKPGGRLVINAIRKEEADKEILQQIDYPAHLWLEKEIKSVANVERRDVEEFLDIAAKIPIKPEYQEYNLEDANTALMELKNRRIKGAKVLKIF